METEIVERCTDIDECQTQQPCGPGTCINTDGSSECICPCGRIGRNCESGFSTLVRPSVPVCLLVMLSQSGLFRATCGLVIYIYELGKTRMDKLTITITNLSSTELQISRCMVGSAINNGSIFLI